MVTKKLVEDRLRQVLDPELGINIVDLGLVYQVSTTGSDVHILMTLTFPGCPLGATIKNDINQSVGKIPDVGKVDLEITFDPPWDLTKMNQEARAELGMI